MDTQDWTAASDSMALVMIALVFFLVGALLLLARHLQRKEKEQHPIHDLIEESYQTPEDPTHAQPSNPSQPWEKPEDWWKKEE